MILSVASNRETECVWKAAQMHFPPAPWNDATNRKTKRSWVRQGTPLISVPDEIHPQSKMNPFSPFNRLIISLKNPSLEFLKCWVLKLISQICIKFKFKLFLNLFLFRLELSEFRWGVGRRPRAPAVGPSARRTPPGARKCQVEGRPRGEGMNPRRKRYRRIKIEAGRNEEMKEEMNSKNIECIRMY